MPDRGRIFKPQLLLLSAVWLLLFLVVPVWAQSTDPTFPTPVGSKVIDGVIPPRDLGDSRLTDQYFGFIGTPGDLIVTVEVNNLNGDFDIFTAGELKPLLKITVYAEFNTPVTKNIYLRRRENLILRVEGRTPNDDEASYSIRFSGSFEPVPGGVKLAKADRPPEASSGESNKSTRSGGRDSSVGARIEEPREVAATPTPAPTPEPTPVATAAAPAVASEPVASPKKTAKRSTPANTNRTATAKTTKPAETTTAKTVAEAPEKTATATAEQPTASVPETTATAQPVAVEKSKTEPVKAEKKSPASSRSNKPKSNSAAKSSTETPDEGGARLDIERKDGTHLQMPMRTVTKVTVEKGQILIVTKDGTTLTVPMANVARMSIGP